MFTQSLNYKWIVGALLLIYVSIQIYCIQQLTLNYDEGSFASYGASILKLQGNKDVVKFDSKLPVTALNMLPRAIQQVFNPHLSKPNSQQDVMWGRYISLLAAITLALVIYHWCSLLYGNKAGLFVLILFLLCPNFLAHGVFVSSDVFACLFITSSLYFLWQFNRTNLLKNFVYASMLVGLAQVSKFSMVHLPILFLLLFTIKFFFGKGILPQPAYSFIKFISFLFVFIVINWFIISAAHLFYGMFIPLSKYQFRSISFQQVQSFFQAIGNYLPLPLPAPYIKSMDAVMYFDHLGGGMPGSLNGPSYLLGKSQVHGFWNYYFIVLLYKLPIATLLLIAATLFIYIKKTGWNQFVQNEMHLILPTLYYLIYMNFFYSTQIGIRHILVILPLLYIFIGFLYQQINTVAARLCCFALVVYQCISVALYFPHFLPYTNELIINKKLAYKKIADTNICYGEGAKYLKEYLLKNPAAKYLPEKIESGQIIMEVNKMVNLSIASMGKYDWARSLEPVNHIHSQYLVFNVTPALADSLINATNKKHE